MIHQIQLHLYRHSMTIHRSIILNMIYHHNFKDKTIYQNRSTEHQIHHRPSRFLPLHPDLVVEKYISLKTPSKMSTLAVKLARESFFGKNTMEKCTPKVKSEYDSLSEANLYDLKLYLVQSFPSLSRPDFEGYWKGCLNSIGQACKGLRAKNKK